MIQGSEAWFEARRGRISASQAGALLGISSFGSAAAARRDWVLARHGHRREFDTPDMARGRRLEPIIIELYEDYADKIVYSDPGRPFEDWLWASPDGLVDDGMVEIKAPRRFHEQPYLQYLVQMLIQMVVYDRNWVDFVQGVETDGEVRITVERFLRSDLMKTYPRALDDLLALWKSMMDEPMPEKPEGREDDEWRRAEQEYAAAKENIDSAKAWADEARDELLTLAGGSPTKGIEWQVVESTRTGSVDLKKVAKDYPEIDLDKYRGVTTTSLSVRAMAKEKT